MESIASQCLYGGVEERQKDWEGIELKIHESQVAGASTREVENFNPTAKHNASKICGFNYTNV